MHIAKVSKSFNEEVSFLFNDDKREHFSGMFITFALQLENSRENHDK